MSQVIKVSLPGYDAQADTNPDHFALYFDENDSDEYILIKEKDRGSGTVNDSATATIAHNLGYIPFVVVFFEKSSGVWRKLVGYDEFNGFDIYVRVTTSNITISNFTGSAKDYKYYIFYDVMDGSSSNDLDLTGAVLAITKKGKDVIKTTDPNDFIFHSNFNTLKIISEATYSSSVNASTTTIFSVTHGLSYIPLVHGFAKFNDWDYAIPPNEEIFLTLGSSAVQVRFNYIEADSTKVYFSITNSTGSSRSFSIRYYFFEVPLD